jgi:hypothetical protein
LYSINFTPFRLLVHCIGALAVFAWNINSFVTRTMDSHSNEKCSKCDKRLAREGCTQSACLLCCTDVSGCEPHSKSRAQAQWRKDVLEGATEIQRLAAQRRKLRIPEVPGKRFFRESGFVYQGDTVVIWDLHKYARNAKWRDDAIRKSLRRRKTITPADRPRLRINRQRFRRIMNELYNMIPNESSS